MIPIGGLALAALAGLAWAGLDALRKRLSEDIAPIPLLVLINLGLLPVFGAWWAAAGGGIDNLGAYALPSGLGLALQIVANVLFLAAVRASPLSLTIPFLALTPVFATLSGALWLDEQPAPIQLAGVALVVAGALTLGSSSPEPGPDGRIRLLQVFRRERGAWMMTGVALCWGVTVSLDKLALAHASVPAHALVQMAGVSVAALGYLAARKRLGELAVGRDTWLLLGAATAAGAVAFGVQLLALKLVLVSVLEAIKRALGLVGAVVLGQLVFHEAITPAKIVAIVLMGAGVILVVGLGA